MKPTKKHTSHYTSSSISTIAVLLCFNFVIAFGTVVLIENSPTRRNGYIEEKTIGISEEPEQKRKDNSKDTYHRELTQVLAKGSYHEWETFIRTHPHVRKVIRINSDIDAIVPHLYTPHAVDTFGLPVGKGWRDMV